VRLSRRVRRVEGDNGMRDQKRVQERDRKGYIRRSTIRKNSKKELILQKKNRCLGIRRIRTKDVHVHKMMGEDETGWLGGGIV
jgi:hypothetical protein